MGQQQLLLIVLGVIIIGIAILVAVNLYTANLIRSNEESLTAETLNVGGLAQIYYNKPYALAGGQGTFIGFTIPPKVADSENGVFSVESVSEKEITIKGLGKIKDSENKVARSTIIVTPYSMTLSEMIRVDADEGSE